MTGRSEVTGINDVWSETVVDTGFGGHEGRVYERRPRNTLQLLPSIERWGDRDFLVHADRRYSYTQFTQAIHASASTLAGAGVVEGDSVVIMAFNSPELLLAVWASWRLGAVPVLANRWWESADTRASLDLTQPRLVLTDHPEHKRFAGHHVLDLSSLTAAWGADASGDELPLPDTDEESIGLVAFTSGSSGAPKAVALSHRAIIANQQNLLVRGHRLPSDVSLDARQEATLLSTPLFHVGGISTMINTSLIGNRLVLTHGKFDPLQVLQLIQRESVTVWGGVPTMVGRVVEHPDFDSFDLSSLRSLPVGGAPLPPTLHDRMTTKLPQLARRGLGNTWGMTESGGFVTSAGNAELADQPTTVGRPFAVAEIRIADADAAGSGEILLRTPSMMSGYLGEAENPIDSHGWLHTGDIGRIVDGLLFVDGRSKDVIIRGGENIAARRVEDAIATHPEVLEVAVVGAPHEDLGEEVVAVVVAREGSSLSEEALRKHVRGHLAYFEMPARWILRAEHLPTLPGEKIDKRFLKETLIA